MDAAKNAIKNFTSHGGHHDTTVHEHVNPAVEQQNFQRKELEQTTTVVDKEVHQDHHHTTVLPVKDREVLPEQHTHNLVGTESREYRHGDHEGIKDRLAQEAAQFKSTRTEAETTREERVAPTVGGEHVHHHIHETVQPVIQKDVIQPAVIHTVVPVHETHHNAPQHHGASALPAMTMEEFKNKGGTLEGCGDKVDRFEGIVPVQDAVKNTSHGFHHHGAGSSSIEGNAARDIEGTGTGTTGHHGHHGHHHGQQGIGNDTYDSTGTTGATRTGGLGNDAYDTTGTTGTTGITGNTRTGGTTGTGYGDNTTGYDTTGSRGAGYGDNATGYDTTGSRGAGYGNDRIGTDGPIGSNTGGSTSLGRSNAESANLPRDSTTTGGSNYSGTTAGIDDGAVKKPSLLDRLNPMKDSDGDGKKGIMK